MVERVLRAVDDQVSLSWPWCAVETAEVWVSFLGEICRGALPIVPIVVEVVVNLAISPGGLGRWWFSEVRSG